MCNLMLAEGQREEESLEWEIRTAEQFKKCPAKSSSESCPEDEPCMSEGDCPSIPVTQSHRRGAANRSLSLM